MIRLFIRLSLCFIWFCGLCMFSSAVWAATLNVPSIEYPTIQSAIDAALIGDTVLVADGTYTGTYNKSLDFNGKAITVQSENGPETCIIDCEGSGLGFYFHSVEPKDAVVSGFTITRGSSGGIRISDASPTIRNCTISACSSVSSGGGIDCSLSESGEYSYSPNFENCTLTGNSAGKEGGGMFCSAASYSSHPSSITITNCTFSNNEATDSGGMSCSIFSYASLNMTGCTFTGNEADESVGGLSCTSYRTTSSLTVKTCTFENNTAKNYDGGGIKLNAEKPSTLKIIDCTINDNTARRGGGGIFCRGVPNITRCTISGNTLNGFSGSAAFGGGGIFCDVRSAPNITGCTISANFLPYFYSGSGGGIYVGNNSSVTINGCTISENYAHGDNAFGGGGIYCSTGSYPVVISNCIIKGNSTDCRGGGILCMFSSPTISNCEVIDNSASTGGGIYFYNSHSTSFIESCDISHNAAQEYGGGIYTYESDPLVVNTTITNNSASDYFYSRGGGFYLSSDDLILASSTVSQNTASDAGGGILADYSTLIIVNSIMWNDSPQEIGTIAAGLLIVYSNIQGGVSGEGNINEDPEFVDPLNDDFHLASNSPCIDKGTNDLLDLPETDKDGKPRVIDGNGDSNAVIDMGAYEFGDICEGDFDGDGDVDGSDLAVFAADFGRTDCTGSPDPCEGDFDNDGDVDGSDLAVFAADFGRTDCPINP